MFKLAGGLKKGRQPFFNVLFKAGSPVAFDRETRDAEQGILVT